MSFEKPWGNYLLDKMVETTAPETISFFPQTMAWQLIFLLLILFTIKKCYRLWKSYQDNAYRREALAWLAQCSLTNEEDVRQLPALLRKTALLANGVTKNNNTTESSHLAIMRRNKITQLSGNAWLTWLDEHCTKTQFSAQGFSLSSEKLLTQLAYMPKLELFDDKFNNALNQLNQQIEIWIKYHDLNKQLVPDGLGEQA